jgi:hypothetical protein
MGTDRLDRPVELDLSQVMPGTANTWTWKPNSLALPACLIGSSLILVNRSTTWDNSKGVAGFQIHMTSAG